MTADYIAYHAAERPDAIAVVNDGRPVTFAEFSRDIRKAAHALREFGLPPGGSVAVGCDDFYLHWLLLLGLEQLGIASATLQTREGPSALPLLASMDLVLGEHAYPDDAAKRHRLITPDWVRGIFAHEDGGEAAAPSKAPEDTVRILRTSGTTGASKRLRFSRRQLDIRASAHIWGMEFTRRSRCLMSLPFTLNSSYLFAVACIRAGGTVISEKRMGAVEAISAHAISHVMLLPIHLRALLDALPETFEKPSELLVLSLGAPLSDALREKAMTRLAGRVCDLYGTQEVGNIAWTLSSGRRGIATLWPDVQVRVVDEAGAPLPPGRPGRLGVRTPHMSERYLDDPDATARMYADGWFYPGDVVILREGRRLEIVGRGDDLLNVGGTKIPPGELEELILKRIDAKDAGVCSIRNRDGIEEIWIAVADCPTADRELVQRLEQALGRLQLGTFHVTRLPRVPRNASGKIQRDLLRAAITGPAGRTPESRGS